MQPNYPRRRAPDDHIELWGRDMDRQDWERGTYGAADYQPPRGYDQPPHSYGRGPAWERGDWQRPSYGRQDREGWQRSPNFEWQRPGTSGWGQDWWAHPPTREEYPDAWSGPSGGQPFGEPWERPFDEPRRRTFSEPWGQPHARPTQHWHGSTPLRGWQRSDDRIREDVCLRLSDHPGIDSSDIEVSVSGGEVTLDGSVDHRSEKRLAEDLAESVPGVRDVHNHLRTMATQVTQHGQWAGEPAYHGGARLRPGMQVVGIDGHELGHIKEVQANQFVLDRPQARAVCVPLSFVQSTVNDQVVLSIPASQLEAMHWPSPEAASFLAAPRS